MQRIGGEYPVQDENGNAQNAATVTVLDPTTLLPIPTIYSAAGSFSAPAVITNPVITDAVGRWNISLPDGRYTFRMAGGNITSYDIVNVTVFDNTVTFPSPALGTVTSVGLSLPAIFNVTNSPVTGTGTLTGALANQNANLFFAGPGSGGPATPTIRAMVLADLPALGPAAATYGTGALIPVLVVNAQGITTGLSTTTNTPAYASVTGKPTTQLSMGLTDQVVSLFRQFTNVTLANSVTETSLIGGTGNGAGTLTIGALQLVKGSTIKLEAFGFLTAGVAGTLRLKFKLGSSILDTTAINFTELQVSAPFKLECILTAQTIFGPDWAWGQILLKAPNVLPTSSNTVTFPNSAIIAQLSIDHTVSNVMDLTAQWGTADVTNTITVTNCRITLEG